MSSIELVKDFADTHSVAAVSPRARVDGEAEIQVLPCIAIIERRALLQSSLAEQINKRLDSPVRGFSSLQDWIDGGRVPVSLFILCGHTASDYSNPDAFATNLQSLLKHAGDAPVVVAGDCEDPSIMIQALQLGAKGFAPTSLKIEVWIEALRLVRAGGVFAPASLLLESHVTGHGHKPQKLNDDEQAVSKVRIDEMCPGGPHLTSRQVSVVSAIAKGKPNTIIAYELNMSESTVKVHVRNIMKKLSAKNRTEVALMASDLLRGQ